MWSRVCGALAKLSQLLSYTPHQEHLKAFGRRLLTGQSRRLGWEAQPGEQHLTTLLRNLLLGRMAVYDDPEVFGLFGFRVLFVTTDWRWWLWIFFLYVFKNESTFPCVCVRYVRKGESAPWGLKIWKKYPKNAELRIMEGCFSDQPDREHGNPLKPVRTRDDVDKKLGQWDRRRFQRISSALRGRFPPIPSIFGESAVMTSRPRPSP